MIDIFVKYGGSYLAIIVVLILTGSGLPIPEEVPIIAAGILSAHGTLQWEWALASCLFGALAGDCLMYWIGYHFGRSVVREHPWWAHFVKPEREAKIERMLEKHGLKVFFLARFLVGLRSPVYLSAGIMRVPFRRFMLIDLFCATVVIGLFFSLSYRYGQKIADWIHGLEWGLTAIVLLALLAAAIIYFRRRRRRRLKDAESADTSDDSVIETP
jgi:membrane protein DedA with SNARE-associated domain